MSRLWGCLALCFVSAFAGICKNDDYTPLGNGKCYRVYTTMTSASSASAACHLTGGELASIHSDTDNYIVGLWLSGNLVDEAWIGLQCPDLGSCRWLDGSPLNYTHFNDNPPDLDEGKCFYMKSGMVDVNVYNTWNTASCSAVKKATLCEEVTVKTTPAVMYTTFGTLPPFSYSLYCPASAFYLDGYCYTYHDMTATESEAEAMCSPNGHLVAIHSASQNAYIYNIMKYYNARWIWIGLKQLSNGMYYWTDSSTMDYNNIAPDIKYKPGTCFAMSNVNEYYPSQWVAFDCSSAPMPFLCMQPASYQTPTPTPPSPCGQLFYGGSNGTINSPRYPGDFGDATCYYLINATSRAVNIEIPPIFADGLWSITLYEGLDPDPNYIIGSITSKDPMQYLRRSSRTNFLIYSVYASSRTVGQPFMAHYNTSWPPMYPTMNITTPTTTTTTPAPSKRCDSGWILNPNMGLCYAVTRYYEYFNVQSVCRLMGGQPISIHSDTEERALYSVLNQVYANATFDVWLGGSYTNGFWSWLDGSPFNYQAWIGGYANATTSKGISASSRGVYVGWVPEWVNNYYPVVCIKSALPA